MSGCEPSECSTCPWREIEKKLKEENEKVEKAKKQTATGSKAKEAAKKD